MAIDKRKAKQKLAEFVVTMEGHRNNQGEYSRRGDAAGVEKCRSLLKLDHRHIREHCAEHDLDVPPDLPDEGAE